jgi:CheY-like chemotaxis protein
MLTPRHHALLVYINHKLTETGRSPSLEEMKDAVKASSMSSVHRAIAALEERGFISRVRGRPRAINVLRLPEKISDLPKDRTVTPTSINGDLLRYSRLASDLPTAQYVPSAKLSGDDREAAGPSMEAPFERVTSPAPDGTNGVPTGQEIQMATVLAIVLRARELVGDVVWAKLSVRTQSSILRSELYALDLERGAAPAATGAASHDPRTEPGVSLASHRFPAADARAAAPAREARATASVPAAEPRRNRNMVADPRMATPPQAREGATVPEAPEVVPAHQALQMAMDVIRRGYGFPEASRNLEIIAQAIELSFLQISHGLVTTKPEPATDRAGADLIMVGNLPRVLGSEAIIDRVPRVGPHILVVDDVSDVLVTVRAFLVTAGFVVVTAADGDAALGLIASDPLIGVLVTDFVMPGMSGVDLIVQALQLRSKLKSLLITGFPNADGLTELPPGVAVLAKPFRRAALIKWVGMLAGDTPPLYSDEVTEIDRAND